MNRFWPRALLLTSLLLALPACNRGSDQNAESLTTLPACNDQSLQELARDERAFDEACRNAIATELPGVKQGLLDRLLRLGSRYDEASDRYRILIHGLDANGNALDADNLARLEVFTVEDGERRALPASALNIGPLGSGEGLSLSLVGDYSASMRDEDLDAMAALFRDIVTALPDGIHGQVVWFSANAMTQQSFTGDRATLLAAVARNDNMPRSRTALYDGMGLALSQIQAHGDPFNLLVLVTDGRENASSSYTPQELASLAQTQDVFVLMLGSLLADEKQLRQRAGEHGAYLYAPNLQQLRSSLQQYIAALGALSVVELPGYVVLADELELDLDGQTLRFNPTR